MGRMAKMLGVVLPCVLLACGGDKESAATPGDDTPTLYTVTGRMTLAAATVRSSNWEVYLVKAVADTEAASIASGTVLTGATTIDFTLVNVPAGDYFLLGLLDGNQDGNIQGSIDEEGGYAWTSAHLPPSSPTFHVNANANLTGVTFSTYQL